MTGIVGGKVERPLVIHGDARQVPLKDGSIDLVITSPPFWNLRDYGVAGQIGNEATREAFLQQLWQATAECKRVMKPTASLFVELGDSYANRATPERVGSSDGLTGRGARPGRLPRGSTPEKSLNLTPQRYAIGCVDQLGLILRAEIIWNRLNGLPESVTDRPRLAHSRWFMFVKQSRYFAALDELREPQATIGERHGRKTGGRNGHPTWLDTPERALDPRGKLPGSVWSIPSEPLRLPPWINTQHYAAFPTEWPRRLILGFTPHLICGVCGVGRFPVVARKPMVWRQSPTIAGRTQPGSSLRPASGTMLEPAEATIVGYACGCTPFTDHPGTGEPSGVQYGQSIIAGDGYPPNYGAASGTHDDLSARPKVGPWREYHLDRWTPPPGRPALVLDPFGGTGTVAHVARALGRHAITIDLSEAYCRLATDQTLARQRAAKVLGRVHQERQGTLL